MATKPWSPDEGCKTHDITLDNDVVVHNPFLVLCAGLGVLVGIAGFFLTRKYLSSETDHNSPYLASSYTLIYMSFACMNFSGLVVWCFSDKATNNNNGHGKLSSSSQLWLMIDGIFSSLTSFNFIIAWMTDVGWFSLNKKWHKSILFFCYQLIAIGYFAETYLGWRRGWDLLYIQLTQVGSVSYFLAQFIMMVRSNNFTGIRYLLIAGAVGLIGLTTFQNDKVQKFYCDVTLGWFDGLCVWYTQSDMSLALLLTFAITRYGKPPKIHPHVQNGVVLMEDKGKESLEQLKEPLV